MFSTTSEYAVCILGHVARRPESAVRAADLAETLDLPASYTAKVLQRLRQGGFLHSERGREGGFRLALPAQSVRLFDVVRFLDGEESYTGCLLGRDDCSDRNGCPLHDYWARVKEFREEMLRDVTVADLASGRPIPVSSAASASLAGTGTRS